MSLSTHTAYREVMVMQNQGGSHQWFAKMIERDGSVVEQFGGIADSDKEAKTAAKSVLDAVEEKYLIEKEG